MPMDCIYQGNSDRNDDDSHLSGAVLAKAGVDLKHDPRATMNTTSRDLPGVWENPCLPTRREPINNTPENKDPGR